MARYGQRPENALKRANEFIEVGKPARALDTLYEVFRNKKWAYNWSESVLEPIMFKYLDLCVELKKSHIAKEGLFQYRNMFQSVNVSSLENVIRGYLRAAEERTEAAREQSQQAVVDIDDLDNLATPESLLLSAVSGEDAHDRSDRTILTPWVKFLWESYCQCLELLRTNAHVEGLYHDIARMAFSFCLKYNRKTEFRKLCDKLRKHLEDISKLPAQTVNVSIHKPETQQLNLDTRLVQLDSAIQMELWQEAYKAIEDIHGLMNLSKKLPVPKTMANYYQKLAMVFWKAGNNLFHAAALFKLFQLSKDMKKNISSEELQRMACRVLLATLSIPLPSAHPEFNCFIETDKSPMEKAQRLAVLLHLPQPPSRASLLRDIMRMNVVGLATPRLQELYQWLEVDFDPLLLCSRVESVVNELTETSEGDVGPTTAPLKQYVQALQDVTLVRLIRQLAQVYQTVEFSRMLELARFTDKFHLERLLVDCVRHNDMQIRIDHGKNCINFGMDLSEAQREDKPEGPQLQPMPSEQIRTQLIDMARVLHRAMQTINPHKRKNERDQQRTQMVKLYNETRHREHQRILERHKIIEDRKEYLERLNTVREEEELRRQEELARQQALAEQRRLEQEREERERKRHENEIQQIKDRHLKEKMQQISQTTHGQKILKKLDEDDIKKLDAEAIAAREAEELQKERRELQQRLKSQEKKVDYFERAKRVEELPLFQSAFEEQQIADRQFWNQHEAERIEKLVEERRLAVQHRERLARMTSDQQEFVNKLRAERKSAYEEKLLEFEKTLDEERRKRLAERKAVRKEERRQQWLEEREEEAKRKKEEEARRKAEEEEKAARLQKQQEEDEYRRRKEELDRQEEIRKQREKEVMERREIQERTQSTNSSWRKSNAPIERPSVQQREEERESAPPTETSSGQWRARGAREERPAPTRSNNAPAEPWRPTRAREPDSKLDSWRRGGSERDAPVEKENRDRDRERQGERDERGDRDRNDRIERNGRDDRNDRIERNDRNVRDERNDRVDRNDRIDRNDRNDRGAWRDDRGDRIANTGGGGGGGSWRSKASEPEDDDRRSRRIGGDRSGAGGPPPERDSWRSSKDSSAPSGTSMRRPGPQAPATPQRRAEEPASAPPLRENRREWK